MAAISASEVLHPVWCVGGEDCAGDLPDGEGIQHRGAATTWGTADGDTGLTLRLARCDA
jgi:hypothetical protein